MQYNKNRKKFIEIIINFFLLSDNEKEEKLQIAYDKFIDINTLMFD